MEVASGVDKVEGQRVANAYVVTIQDGLLLVDSGMPGNLVLRPAPPEPVTTQESARRGLPAGA
jgi:hypothetical protein